MRNAGLKLDKDALQRTKARWIQGGGGLIKINLLEMKVEYLKYDLITVTTFLEKLGNSLYLK